MCQNSQLVLFYILILSEWTAMKPNLFFLEEALIYQQQRDFPPGEAAWRTCSWAQAVERIRRSSLRQVEMTRAMTAGLVLYFTWGGAHIKDCPGYKTQIQFVVKVGRNVWSSLTGDEVFLELLWQTKEWGSTRLKGEFSAWMKAEIQNV